VLAGGLVPESGGRLTGWPASRRHLDERSRRVRDLSSSAAPRPIVYDALGSVAISDETACERLCQAVGYIMCCISIDDFELSRENARSRSPAAHNQTQHIYAVMCCST
jgi:hypothetical protein